MPGVSMSRRTWFPIGDPVHLRPLGGGLAVGSVLLVVVVALPADLDILLDKAGVGIVLIDVLHGKRARDEIGKLVVVHGFV